MPRRMNANDIAAAGGATSERVEALEQGAASISQAVTAAGTARDETVLARDQVAIALAATPGNIQRTVATPTVPPPGIAAGAQYYAALASGDLQLYVNDAGVGAPVQPPFFVPAGDRLKPSDLGIVKRGVFLKTITGRIDLVADTDGALRIVARDDVSYGPIGNLTKQVEPELKKALKYKKLGALTLKTLPSALDVELLEDTAGQLRVRQKVGGSGSQFFGIELPSTTPSPFSSYAPAAPSVEGVTDTTATVKVSDAPAALGLQLTVSRSSKLKKLEWSASAIALANGLASMQVDTLEPNTTYYFGVGEHGKVPAVAGSFTTATAVPTPYFANNGIALPWYSIASYSPAAYHAGRQETWIANETSIGEARFIQVSVYSHAQGKWLGAFKVGDNALVDDSHGVPSVCHLPDGRVAIFGAAHNSQMQCWVTAQPGDPSLWVKQQGLGTALSYPHPIVVNGVLHLFVRQTVSSSQSSGVYDLQLYKSTSLANGTITFGAPTKVLTFETDSRVYNYKNVLRGTDIHQIITRADSADDERRGIYYLIYDTLTGNYRNLAGGHIALAADMPVDLAESNTYFRLMDTEPDVYTGMDFAWSKVTANVMGLAFIAAGQWKFRRYTNGVASADVFLANVDDRTAGLFARTAAAGGGWEFWYPSDDDNRFTTGGNMRRIVIAEDGTPSPSELMRAAGTYALGQPSEVIDGVASARIVYCERGQNEATEYGNLKLYTEGEAARGPLNRTYGG